MKKSIDYIGDLILLRGITNCGKTTLGKVILKSTSNDDPDVISSEDLLIDDNGNTIDDKSKIIEIQNYCLQRCVSKMKNEFSKIVVADRLEKEEEINLYIEIAERYRYRVHVVLVQNEHLNNL